MEKRSQRLRAQAKKKSTNTADRAKLLEEAAIIEAKRKERDRKRLTGSRAMERATAALARAKWERGEG